MIKKLSVLIIEGHPMVSNSYKTVFERIQKSHEDLNFKISTVSDCESANNQIDEMVNDNLKLDIVFLDINLPPAPKLNMFGGEDIGIKIKEVLPDTKIIVSTTYFDHYRIQGILKSIDPDGFLVKNDFDYDDLIEAILKVIQAPPYYSDTVLNSLRKRITSDHIIDEIDRKLMYELSIGTKMKELPNMLLVSMAGIENRKRRLKEIFDIQHKEDRDLILLAKEKGFI